MSPSRRRSRMIKAQSLSLSRLSPSLLLGLASIVCNGCATDGVRQQAAYDRKIQRTEQLLIAAGDADSLAAAAMLSVGPTFDPAQRLSLSARAVSKAPDRPDLVWLNLRLCTQVDTCNPEPLEAQLHALDPDNGAAWFDSIGRAGRRNDVVAVRKDLAAIATYVDAISARRVAHYRIDADGKMSLRRFLFPGFAAKRLLLMTEKTTEQEVILAEILNAKRNPDPPSDYTDS